MIVAEQKPESPEAGPQGPAVASELAPARPLASAQKSAPAGRIRVSRRAGVAVAAATLLHHYFLILTSSGSEGAEVAGYVVATSSLAMVAQLALVSAAAVRVSWLPRALVLMMGLGLLAQAACPIDGHVSVTDSTFMLQTVSWLGYGIAAIAVLARTQLRAEKAAAH